MKKLSKFIQSFNQSLFLLNADINQLRDDFTALDPLLPTLFPADPAWDSQQKPYLNLFTAENLPFHTRDDVWLARYIARVAAEQGMTLDLGKIEKYVQLSSKFDAARFAYEQNLVKCRIAELQDNPRSNVLFAKDEPVSNFLDDVNYDKLFRTDVVKSFEKLAVPRHSIEAGLENYAGLWREAAMRRTFDNLYYPDTLKPRDPFYRIEQKACQDNKQNHQDHWVRMREYEYYRDHHKIIDELGLATANMKLKPAEVNTLARKCKFFHDHHQILFTLPPRAERQVGLSSVLTKRRQRQHAGMSTAQSDEQNIEALRR